MRCPFQKNEKGEFGTCYEKDCPAYYEIGPAINGEGQEVMKNCKLLQQAINIPYQALPISPYPCAGSF